MKIKHLSLIAFGIALIFLAISPALACVPPPPPPGYTPGYWRHQFNAYIDGKGSPQETWGNLVTWTAMIDAVAKYYSFIGLIDYDHNGTFTTDDAHNIFNDQTWNYLWTPLANLYNLASGRSLV